MPKAIRAVSTGVQRDTPALKLVEFEKGEIRNAPLQPLNRFYIIVRGSMSIYSLTEDDSICYISKAASGTLLGDMGFSGAGNQSFYIILRLLRKYCALPFWENLTILENDLIFLRFVLSQLARKTFFVRDDDCLCPDA